MTKGREIQEKLRALRGGKLLFLPHAIQQMTRPERMISRHDVRNVVENGEVIEDYPNDARGHSCLILGFGLDRRPIHVVCAPRGDYVAIITAYLPNPDEWNNGFRVRKTL
ncbi:MAG: hypothetical protein A2Y76_15370 [Planctomycetes bacterium RBG_13_60_9]|nr:MAG: hypothetical protein A2Y76_15370 [Planctomycetes bacterium RBG_13_60_9]